MKLADLIFLAPAGMTVALVWLAIIITRQRLREANKPRPTYYVKHPDGSFTEADPKP